MQLHGKVAIVTGASREIGAAMAEALARAGAAVLATYNADPTSAEQVVARITAAGGRAAAYPGDLGSVAAAQAMVARAVELFGRLDILAANAGITLARPFLETGEADWDRLFDLNVKGSYFLAQAAAKQMIAQAQAGTADPRAVGRIVFSSSVTGVAACRNMSAYGITKAALIHMARTLGVELGGYGITVNALGIGATLNERNLRDDPHYAEHWANLAPTGRVGTPEDAADALLYLASPAAAMVNGHTLMIDGGWTNLSPLP